MEDYDSSDFEVDYDYFNDRMWATIAHRIPAFECLKVNVFAKIFDAASLKLHRKLGKNRP